MGGPPSRLRRFGGQTSLVARLAGLPDEARRRRAKSGAEEGIRTPTILRSPAPQAGASASSATSACKLDVSTLTTLDNNRALVRDFRRVYGRRRTPTTKDRNAGHALRREAQARTP